MRLKISFSSVDMIRNPVEWMYSLEDAGFQGWEIVAEGPQKVEGEFKTRLKELYETTNLVLSLHAPLSDINIASVNEPMWAEGIRQIKESIEDAYEFIDDICVVHPGFFSPLSVQIPEKAIGKAVAALTTLCGFAAERGLRIALENLTSANMLMGRFPDELVHILQGVNADNLGLCLDVAHANTTRTLDEFLDTVAKADDVEIIHLHASDNFGKDDLHLPLGKGNMDWKRVLRGINELNYEGLMVLELFSVEGGVESLEFIQKLLP
jgi:sugar phosphate isomerase/epimerase